MSVKKYIELPKGFHGRAMLLDEAQIKLVKKGLKILNEENRFRLGDDPMPLEERLDLGVEVKGIDLLIHAIDSGELDI